MATVVKMKNQATRFHTVQKRDALAQSCQHFYRDRLKDVFFSQPRDTRYRTRDAQTSHINTSYKLRSDHVAVDDDVPSVSIFG